MGLFDDPLLVSAIMITGKSPERRPFALAALQSFREQTRQRKELVIINTSKDKLLNDENKGTDTCEVYAPPDLNLGDLRNLGLGLCNGRYVVQWDDDDWSHPRRIEMQLRHLCYSGVQACTFLSQIRYNFKTGYCYVHHQYPRLNYDVGIPGTIMHYVTNRRYPSRGKSEDTVFAKAIEPLSIFTNPPEYYLRFYHGANTWGESHIMGPEHLHHTHTKPSESQMTYLKEVLEKNYAFANPVEPRAFQQ